MGSSMRWILALAALGMGAAALIFGTSMLPPAAVMQSKLGTIAPLYITWGMIWLTVAIAVALAAFLIGTGLGIVRDDD